MPKLSKTQRELLEAAHQSADGHIDTPDGEASAVGGLIKRNLMISIPRENGPSRLLITQAGRAACGPPSLADANQAGEPQKPSAPETGPAQAAHQSESTPKGKIGALLNLLRQPDGASVEAMMAATGWQAHSVRGALSGAIKRKLGLAVISEKTDAGRTYRISSGAGQTGGDPKAMA